MHYFHNPGVLDLDAITTLGVSVKDESAIGQFGTGAKYAVANILANGGTIAIESGGTVYDFSARPITVRGKDFHKVCLSVDAGERVDLGFTTDLGKHWKPWQVFRELICNAWDEGGDYTTDRPEADTVVTVDWAAFDTLDWQQYFYRDWDKLSLCIKSERVNTYFAPKALRGKAFFKGVYVGELPGAEVVFDLHADGNRRHITEDRTLSSLWPLSTTSGTYANDAACLRLWTEMATQSQLASYIPTPSSAQMSKLIPLYNAGKIKNNTFAYHLAEYNRQQPPTIRAPFSREQRAIDRCVDFLARAGIKVLAPVKVFEAEEDRTYANTDLTEIFINHHTFHKGAEAVLFSLIEEHVHVTSRASDETREMQWAFLRMIKGLVEEINDDYL